MTEMGGQYHRNIHYDNSGKDVILFGSQARGDSDENSDFNILIVLDRNYSGEDENEILDLWDYIDLKYNIILDVHILSTSELDSERGKQPIFRNAVKSGIYA